jgi:PAS domain S-box-containing protein
MNPVQQLNATEECFGNVLHSGVDNTTIQADLSIAPMLPVKPPRSAQASRSAAEPLHLSLDPAGQIVAVNQAAAASFGYPVATLVGQPIANLIVRQQHARWQQKLTLVWQQNCMVRGKFDLLLAEGCPLKVQITLQLLHGLNQPIGILCSCTPITSSQSPNQLQPVHRNSQPVLEPSELYQQVQRRNAHLERQVQQHAAQLDLAIAFEETLKRITDRVRDSLDEAQILQTAVQELAIATGVNSCNAAVYDLEHRISTVRYEYTASLVPLQGRTLLMDNFPEGYHQLLSGQYFQFCSLMPNPSRGRVAMLACPIVEDQSILGDLWLVSQAERTFSEQDIRLVQQVANQCAIALRQARLYQAAQAQVKELEKVNQLKDDFLSTVSHELRTPMSNIKMSITMLEVALQRLEVLDNSASALAKYFQILRNESEREIGLINDLLNLAQLESGRELLVLSEMQPRTWLPHLVAPFRERAMQQQQQLSTEIAADLPNITTDRSRFERLICELLNNACKYTPAGGTITLSATLKPTTIAEPSDTLLIQVSNSGIEIAAPELARVFDKFYRIPNHDPWRHGGTGLGLALVKEQVETLGGTITATSRNSITCFAIELPLVAPDAAIGNSRPTSAVL